MHALNQSRKNTRHPNIQIVAQNFGPIEKAEIPLRPLTIFVGESNTGKTYIARLICALHRSFASRLNGEDASKILHAELKNCFGTDSVSELKRCASGPRERMKIALKVREKNRICWALSLSISTARNTAVRCKLMSGPGCRDEGVYRPRETYYLSADRRGLMQTPTDFFKETGNGAGVEMHRIAKALETEILGGTIEEIPPVNEEDTGFRYRPAKGVLLPHAGTTEAPALRLCHASSTVLELAPLVLLLRSTVLPGDLLIIEEPEAHLHPAAQRQLAFTFARLVRAGVRVVVTTHSDWLVQQIGNLIREGEVMKLGGRVGTSKGSGSAQWLTKREVGAWWFHRDKPVSEIPFDCIEGIEPSDYEDIAGELYDNAVELQEQLLQTEDAKRGSR